jgi:Holliday junction DNA helicase RuvA
MIASLEGRVAAVHADHLVLVVNRVGYRVYLPSSALRQNIDDELFLYTSLVVREDSMTLYGFLTAPEQDLFETLITVSGIGPKLAIAILGTLTPDHLRSAVVGEQPDVLVRVPGIGKKMAQKIVLELKDKLAAGMGDLPLVAFSDVNADVLDTLVALGYSIVEAQTAIQALPPDAPDSVEERVRLALQYFA